MAGLAVGLVAATACSGDGDDVAVGLPSGDEAVIDDVEDLNDFIVEATEFDQVDADAQFPEGLELTAGGAPGFTRYVFLETASGAVIPTLVEGPLGDQVRCHEVDLPCSYLELKALHEEGGRIPSELEMDDAELGRLVRQLDELNAFLREHEDVDAACASGFVSDGIHTPNMGSHFWHPEWVEDGFHHDRPEILLYAYADGSVPDGEFGQCDGDTWDGPPMKLVGASLVVPTDEGGAHPEAFAGPLDNWHIHYNMCQGVGFLEGQLPQDECEAKGGAFSPAFGWMIHAWVDTEHDNQLGVFSMWNPTIAPVVSADAVFDEREVRGSAVPDGATQSLISDFVYGGELTVRPGQSIWFNNVDSVPHTVTAGRPGETRASDFDSGVLAPGSGYELSFDEPGTYSLFCSLHAGMRAEVTVEE